MNEFSDQTLKELLETSAIYQYLMPEQKDKIIEKLLSLPQEKKKSVYDLLIKENKKIESIEEEENKKAQKVINKYLPKITEIKNKFLRKIRNYQENKQKQVDEKKEENILKSIEQN
ncbi:hypothetical protein A2483_04385 [Candidatus Peregrinibacteria bacterium RIFOXYC2_FULL_33_13]|nr:MAG: ErpL protein [Candidatus Peregrinibacteria bacterium GW2011_GWA2_33_10]KKP38169.1 MAG: hypothetical protein UR30_C0024G0003 [Candidatus Peregrinibacteria bacterium GW2011_GWC2_33_13]OGJ48984.1 MAG: hypothetical protein A2229_00135 [Candidatus Peregrinibacteria bacterium RIFOXYA2_FULL_33_7]OGJ55289.1 MAG: hypothetical protein A2483_04385 [Candidatus Peregrinibacteria bacterium RIFOXYC2_FULL_33_13]